ncbi:hypothetical protein CJJ09_004572 [Candidozyma auris]|nr:hypothetical protein CJJ09_004572 [[Candida] auris]
MLAVRLISSASRKPHFGWSLPPALSLSSASRRHFRVSLARNYTTKLMKEKNSEHKQADHKTTHSHSHDSVNHSHSHDSESPSHSHDHSHDGGAHLFHSHSHAQPNELLGKGFTTNPAVRITWIGLLVNVAMAGSKAVGGVVFHSQALIADAIHSLSDMVADFLTLATVNVASKEGSVTRFPMGYGKIEAVGTFW